MKEKNSSCPRLWSGPVGEKLVIKKLMPISQQLDYIVHSYSHLFKEGLGTLKGATAFKIPVLLKARPVPIALEG